jgi:hypothetical protein
MGLAFGSIGLVVATKTIPLCLSKLKYVNGITKFCEKLF